MPTERFFEETREQSQVKTEIVEKYFYTWARIISASQDRHRPQGPKKIAYIDLFAGPGRYKDGAISTPLRILQKAIDDSECAQRLVTIFNDRDENHVHELAEAIKALPGIERLKYQPLIWNFEVGAEIAKAFESVHTIPILAFIDPWGYKGLSLGLVNSFLKDWGCDCIFFFNYNRINMGLSNPFVQEHMCALFGQQRATTLRGELERMQPEEREAAVVNALALALKEFGHHFVLPFCFKNAAGTRTSHHLILVSKHFKAYEVMKDIMAKYSSEQRQGVPSFTYLPPSNQSQQLLLEFNRPLDDLREMLLSTYAGQILTLTKIYEQHSVDRPFVKKNYTDVLGAIESEGRISVQRPPRGRRGCFGEATTISFPTRP